MHRTCTNSATNRRYLPPNQRQRQKAGNIANFCHEPLKLNGSLPLVGAPLVQYDDELLTSVVASQAPTSPLNIQHQSQPAAAGSQATANTRQHQVLVAGTSDGALKRIVVVPGRHGLGVRGIEFDSVQLDEQRQEPILADLHLLPGQVQLQPPASSQDEPAWGQQFVIAATPHRVAKLRVNACKALSKPPTSNQRQAANGSALADECQQCAQLEDPYCGWCATTASCLSRDDCIQQSAKSAPPQPTAQPTGWSKPLSWQPFDQIRCSDYQPLAPQFVALQSGLTNQNAPSVDVNIRLNQEAIKGASSAALALQLSQAQFSCHFDYSQPQQQPEHRQANQTNLLLFQERLAISGATTKATQARLNLNTLTVVLACPLPPVSQRPHQVPLGSDQLRTRLSVRLAAGSGGPLEGSSPAQLSSLLALWWAALTEPAGQRPGGNQQQQSAAHQKHEQPIERELTFYDCSVHTSCRSCLTSGGSRRLIGCAWCPLSNRCTFNASHPEFGCAASAMAAGASTTSASAGSNQLKASHLAASLDQAQASLLGASIEQPSQCWFGQTPESSPNEPARTPTIESSTASGASKILLDGVGPQLTKEVLIPNEARRSIQVSLGKVPNAKRLKLECLVEIEGAKARLPAKLLELAGQQSVVACQESAFSYQEESATQHGQLTVILNDNQVIESTDGK